MMQTTQGVRTVSLDIRAEDRRQVLTIAPYVAERSLYKPRATTGGTLQRSDTLISAGEAFEAVTHDEVPSFVFNLELAGIGISLINRKVVEVLYVTMDNLKVAYAAGKSASSVEISCGTLEIDNQLHDALFPVISSTLCLFHYHLMNFNLVRMKFTK